MADLRLTIDASDIPKAQAAVGGLERKITDLARRYSQGTISQKTYERGLLQLKRQYERVGISSQKATSEVRRYAAAQLQAAQQVKQATVAQQQFANATQTSTRGVNRSGLIMQQSGYQIGDFIVQVQSGTNAFVAFGQQATQVAGTLTILGGKWILIGSVLGVLIPLSTAIAAAFMRTRKDATEAADGVETFADRLKSARGEIEKTALELERLRGGFEDIAELTLNQAIEQAAAELEAAQRALEGARRRQGSGGPGITVGQAGGGVEEAEEALRLAEEQLETLVRQREEVARIKAEEERRVAIAEAISERLRQQVEAGTRAYQAYLQTTQELNNQLVVQEAINQFGEESVQVQNEMARQARAIFQADLQREGIQGSLLESLMAQYDALQASKEEAEATADALAALGTLDTSSTVSAIAAITRELGVATAAAIELARNLPGYAAGGVSGPDGAIEQTRQLSDQGEGFTMPGFVRESSGRLVQSGPSVSSGRSGGGGGGGGASLQDIINQRMEAIALQREMLTLSEQERQVREIALDLERQYGQALTATEQAAVQSAAQQIAAAERVIEAQERQLQAQKQLADTIATSFGDMFMSILDGTKSAEDAFKDMVKAILKQLIQLAIINPIMDGIRSAIGGGGGLLNGLFSLGGRASGGSVRGGTPYIVGEKGPELFVPGSSGQVKSNEMTERMMGGRGSAPVINMTYNFQGGVTEQDLARALPRIVEETKRSVIDTVQRGGSVARVFK